MKKNVGIGVISALVVWGILSFVSSRSANINATNNNSNVLNQFEIENYAQEQETNNSQAFEASGDPIAELGLKYYMEKNGEDIEAEDVEAVVENYGCHMEIHIYKNEELVMRMAYFNGEVFEL